LKKKREKSKKKIVLVINTNLNLFFKPFWIRLPPINPNLLVHHPISKLQKTKGLLVGVCVCNKTVSQKRIAGRRKNSSCVCSELLSGAAAQKEHHSQNINISA